jgi:hypothetical protein
MSDLILHEWLSDGLERVSNALEVMRLRQEIARLRRENAMLAAEADKAVRGAQETVAVCESFPSLMMRLWKTEWDSAGRAPGRTWNSSGESLRRLFDGAIRVLEAARDCVEAEERLASRSLGLERLDQALAEARRIRGDLETNWLWFSKGAEDEAKASIARGEGMDVDEAFAQMAGISVDELRARVEAHQKRYHPNGDAAR